MPSISILYCTSVLHPIEPPDKLPRLVLMTSMPSSGDLDHFPIHDLSATDTSVEALRYLSHTKIHLMKKMDR